MAPSHGSKAVLKIGTNAVPATAVDVSQYGNSVGVAFSRDASEVTTFALQSKKYIAGLKDATIPFEGPFDDAADQQFWDLYANGTLVNFEYYPRGVGVGSGPKYTGQLMITSYEVSSDVSDPNAVSGEFQVSGDVARTVQ